jgi:hypothetical protein
MAVVPYPPYSPDLTPSDFFLFLKINIKLDGRIFDTVEEIQAETPAIINTLTMKNFEDAFQKWQKLWDRHSAPKRTTVKAGCRIRSR